MSTAGEDEGGDEIQLLAVSVSAVWEFQGCRPLTRLTICFCTIFCLWFPAQAIQVCPDTPGEWQIGSATG